MMLIISVIMILSAALYGRQLLLFIVGLRRLRHGTNARAYSVAVLVAARNEEENIERCVAALDAQNYPRDKFEVIVIDDHSTDRTAGIVEDCKGRLKNVRLLRAQDGKAGISPKINALDYAITRTSSDLIFTTDADCIVGPNWLSSLVSYFDDGIGVVSGVTLFSRTEGVLAGFQALDFFSQTACGAGAIGMNGVNNCNGSNMGFRRTVFTQVGGYSAISHVNSGSDSLLAQRILSTTDWKMAFALEPGAHVFTAPLPSWRRVLEQRMRWAGQTPHYPPATLVFLTASLILYACLFVFVPVSVFNMHNYYLPVLILLIKFALDYWIISYFARLTEVRGITDHFFSSELLHIPVVLAAVLGSFFGSFDWKGRTLRREMPIPE